MVQDWPIKTITEQSGFDKLCDNLCASYSNYLGFTTYRRSNTATTENKSLFEDGAWNGLGADVIKNLF